MVEESGMYVLKDMSFYGIEVICFEEDQPVLFVCSFSFSNDQ